MCPNKKVHYSLISDVSTEQDAPPYTSIHQDPVISYPVTSLGRLVLPAPAPEERLATSNRRAGRRVAPREQGGPLTEESHLSQTQLPRVQESQEDVRLEAQHSLASPRIISSASPRIMSSTFSESPPPENGISETNEVEEVTLTQTRVWEKWTTYLLNQIFIHFYHQHFH